MARAKKRSDRHLQGRGRGGAGDWVAVRLNSLALVGLYAWAIVALVMLPDLSFATVHDWLRDPINSVMMILLVLVSFWHTKYGLKEVIDDYVHEPFPQALAIAAMWTFTILGAAFGVWSVVRIALVPA